jgi:hypothetical protein
MKAWSVRSTIQASLVCVEVEMSIGRLAWNGQIRFVIGLSFKK